MHYQRGPHLLQLPGPTNCPRQVLDALSQPTIDHRGPEFAFLGKEVLSGIKTIFKTAQPVMIYCASGTGAWEAALVNTLSPGDRILMFETGWFASLWKEMAARLGLEVVFVPGTWRDGVNSDQIRNHLVRDHAHAIKAVAVVHNETSTGIVSDIPALRKVLDEVGHPALLLVDAVSSLGSLDYRHDEWGVDVTVSGSQKGLMLPPGLSFNAVSAKALDANRSASFPRSYWEWSAMLNSNPDGYFPHTPNTNLLQALRVSIAMLHDEGLDHVFERHRRVAEAIRLCVRHWGLEIQSRNPGEQSPVLTAVRMPKGHSANRLRDEILTSFNMSLGSGLGNLADVAFRIGHLGYFNELVLLGALSGVEIGLRRLGVPHSRGGVEAAMTYISDQSSASVLPAYSESLHAARSA